MGVAASLVREHIRGTRRMMPVPLNLLAGVPAIGLGTGPKIQLDSVLPEVACPMLCHEYLLAVA